MNLHKIKKQQLLAEPYSKDAQKLACAIYSTYVENDKDPYMHIKTSIVEKILKLQGNENPIHYIGMILEELYEPIAVKDFKYLGSFYPMRLLRFFTYTLDNEHLEIELNEEFLHAEREYTAERFLAC